MNYPQKNYRRQLTVLLGGVLAILATRTDAAAPVGYVTQTIPLSAPPVGLAYAADGVLYAMEEAGFGNNAATVRQILTDGSFGASFDVVGDDPTNLFTGGMTYDFLGNRLLITDNTADGRLYAVDLSGTKQTIADSLPAISGVAVRNTGEIFVSTALGGGLGGVYQIDRTTGAATPVLGGLDYGAGLAFDPLGNLVVQDAASVAPYLGRLQRLPITEISGGLTFGAAETIIAGASAAAGVLVDGEGDVFLTGRGGIFSVDGEPAAETLFYSSGNPNQFATAITLSPGDAAFEPFTGGTGGRVAAMADYGFGSQQSYITLLTPADAEDFNSDGVVDGEDLEVWSSGFGLPADDPAQGDGNADGFVDGADLLQWQRALGASTLLPGLSATGAVHPIPEPTSLSLCVAVLLTGLARIVPFRLR